MTLAMLKKGQLARITDLVAEPDLEGELVRLGDMGLIPGHEVECLGDAPLGDPMQIRVMNYNLCLRRQQARMVEVVLID